MTMIMFRMLVFEAKLVDDLGIHGWDEPGDEVRIDRRG
jgi:hypothetical protein